MRKILMILVLIFTLLFINIGFSEKIEIKYMDSFFDQIKEYKDTERDLYQSILMGALDSDITIENFSKVFDSYLSASELSKLEARGISLEDIRENILKLKTWSYKDRMALIEYGMMDDSTLAQEKIKALNEKNDENDDVINSNTMNDSDTSKEVKAVEVPLKEQLKQNNFIYQRFEIINKDKSFLDLKDHWAKNTIEKFAAYGIINGVGEDNFEPNRPIKESEIISLLIRIGLQDKTVVDTSDIHLSEIYENKWYTENLKIASKFGIFGNQKIDPEEYPSREKIVYYIVNLAEVMNIIPEELEIPDERFIDYETINPNFYEAVIKAKTLGFIHGNPDGTFKPKQAITRGEIIKVLDNFYEYIFKITI